MNTIETKSAVKYFRQALVIAPSHSKKLLEMRTCLEKIGQHDEAAARYDQVIRREPGLKDIREKKS